MTTATLLTSTHQRRAAVGLAYGLAAYFVWGISPLYFKLVAHVPPILVVAHRVVWSFVFLTILLAVQHQWSELRIAIRSRRIVATLLGTTILIGLNWLTFIWAIANEHVMQASLGYFINPLLSVLIGAVVLRERLRSLQVVSIILAAIGVATLIIAAGELPWIAITLAGTFTLYALLRKTSPVAPLVGTTIETALLLPAALMLIFQVFPRIPSPAIDGSTYSLLILAGVVTAVPLLCFTAAAHRLRLVTIGFLQYLAPTCQFLLAVLVFHEPFSRTDAITFGFIWIALAVYSMDSLHAFTRAQPGSEVPA